jgi:hypothetical protein
MSNSLERSQLKDERSLLVAITLEGILPILSCLPIVVMNTVGALSDNWTTSMASAQWHFLGITIDMSAFFVSQTLVQFNPIFDALLTLFCVPQYRRVIVKWFKKISQIKNDSVAVVLELIHLEAETPSIRFNR